MSAVRELPVPARALLLAVVGGGASVLAWRVSDARSWTADDLLAFAALVVAIVVVDQFPIALRHGKETENFLLTEAIWVAGVLLAEPSVLTIAAGAGAVLAQSLRRWAPYKIAFNAGQFVLGVTAAILVFGALGRPDATDPVAWGAAAVAMGACFLVNVAAVALIIGLAEGTSVWRILVSPLQLNVLHWAGNVAVGVLAVLVWEANPAGVPLLLIPMALLYFAYRGWLGSLRERDQMHEMARAADTISEEGDLKKRLPEEGSEGPVAALAATLNRMLGRLEAAFERERRFINEISHELRTPITICRGHLEVLGPDPPQALVRDTAELVVDELGRMGRLVEDLTTLARVEHPQFLRREPLPLDRFLADVAAKAEPLLDGRLRRGHAPAGAVVKADPHRLTQVLINLLQNAALHTPDGSPVDLRVAEEPAWWRFEVEDGGGGLTRGEEERVFEPLRRGSSTAPGSGLGLAIVRGIAEAHGGLAGVENHPGRGVVFWVRVPR